MMYTSTIPISGHAASPGTLVAVGRWILSFRGLLASSKAKFRWSISATRWPLMLRSSSPARNLELPAGVLELCRKNDDFEVGKGVSLHRCANTMSCQYLNGLDPRKIMASVAPTSHGCPRPNGDEPSHEMISSYLFYVVFWRRAVSQGFQLSNVPN